MYSLWQDLSHDTIIIDLVDLTLKFDLLLKNFNLGCSLVIVAARFDNSFYTKLWLASLENPWIATLLMGWLVQSHCLNGSAKFTVLLDPWSVVRWPFLHRITGFVWSIMGILSKPLFNSPEPKAQVSYCHSAPSVVRPSGVRPSSSVNFHIFDFSRTAWLILMKLGRDEVLRVPYKFCCLAAKSAQGWIQGGPK